MHRSDYDFFQWSKCAVHHVKSQELLLSISLPLSRSLFICHTQVLLLCSRCLSLLRNHFLSLSLSHIVSHYLCLFLSLSLTLEPALLCVSDTYFWLYPLHQYTYIISIYCISLYPTLAIIFYIYYQLSIIYYLFNFSALPSFSLLATISVSHYQSFDTPYTNWKKH